jgi:hypothetical protein
MPNPTMAGRRVAWFEDGELWCADDATPPVSPAGWYVRPRGTAVPWAGPFATAEVAEAAPSSADPFAAARRQLDAWARGEQAAARGAPTIAAGTAISLGRPAVDPSTAVGPSEPVDDEGAGARPGRARLDPRPDRGRSEPALPVPGRALGVSGRPAGLPAGPAPEPGLPSWEGGQAGETSGPPDVPTARRQLAFGFGQGGGLPTPSEDKGGLRPMRRKRFSKRGGRISAVQEKLLF